MTQTGNSMIYAHPIRIVVLIFVVAQQLGGCTNTQRLTSDTGNGTKVSIYRHTYDEVWNAAVELASRKHIIIESIKHTGTIRAEAKESTFGEMLGIFINPATEGKKRYVVEVLILMKYKPVTPGDTSESEFIEELKTELGA